MPSVLRCQRVAGSLAGQHNLPILRNYLLRVDFQYHAIFLVIVFVSVLVPSLVGNHPNAADHKIKVVMRVATCPSHQRRTTREQKRFQVGRKATCYAAVFELRMGRSGEHRCVVRQNHHLLGVLLGLFQLGFDPRDALQVDGGRFFRFQIARVLAGSVVVTQAVVVQEIFRHPPIFFGDVGPQCGAQHHDIVQNNGFLFHEMEIGMFRAHISHPFELFCHARSVRSTIVVLVVPSQEQNLLESIALGIQEIFQLAGAGVSDVTEKSEYGSLGFYQEIEIL